MERLHGITVEELGESTNCHSERSASEVKNPFPSLGAGIRDSSPAAQNDNVGGFTNLFKSPSELFGTITAFVQILVILIFSPAAHGQLGFDFAAATVSPSLSMDSAGPGETVTLSIKVSIEEGFHVNSNTPSEEFLIGTELQLSPVEGIELGEPRYPEHKMAKFSFSEKELAVFDGEFTIPVELRVLPDAVPGQIEIKGHLRYQACNDTQCLRPLNAEFTAHLTITSAEDPGAATGVASISPTLTTTAPSGGGSGPGSIGESLAKKGYIWTFLLIFVGGLALNLTPCVYPIIPITLGFFGSQAKGSTGKVFLLALIYVLGLGITYSILGTTVALTGGLFGSILQNPIVLILVAAVLVAVALSSFGLYEIALPSGLTSKIGGGREGYLGALFMGLTVGFVAAPCIGPFVVGLLTYVGQRGDPYFGFISFLTLAMGMGLPYLFLGTFAGSIQKLPRSGSWMIWVKKVLGYVLIGAALFFVKSLIPGTALLVLIMLLLAAAAVHLGWLDKSGRGTKTFRRVQLATGIILLLVTVCMPAVWSHFNVKPDWQEYSADLFAQLNSEGRPAIVDFYADWCVSCIELDKRTFTDERVLAKSKEFVMIKIEETISSPLTPDEEKLAQSLQISGFPTVAFFGPDGRELRDLRLITFEKAGPFLKRMTAALESQPPIQTSSTQ